MRQTIVVQSCKRWYPLVFEFCLFIFNCDLLDRSCAVLVGPVRAASFLLIYGFLSLALGISWSLKIPWTLSVPISSVARLIGYAAYLGLSSVMLGENLLALAIASVHSLLVSGFETTCWRCHHHDRRRDRCCCL